MSRPRFRLHALRPIAFAAALATAAAIGRAEPTGPAPPIDAAWQGVPLRDVAARLTTAGGIAVVVDRRLDPGTLITLSVTAAPLETVLDAVAKQAGAEVTDAGDHLRIAPAEAAARARSATALRKRELRGLPPQTARLAAAPQAWTWPSGSQPRDLIAAAANTGGIALEGLETLPHDHFPAAALPPLSLAERLDLVLLHFDRRVEWRPRGSRAADGRSLFRIVPVETVTAAAADKPARPATRPAMKPAVPDGTYSLKVAAPLDELLATLATRFGLRLDLDRQSLVQRGVAPGEIVRLDLQNLPRDKLLDAILAPLGLRWTITGDTLRVHGDEAGERATPRRP